MNVPNAPVFVTVWVLSCGGAVGPHYASLWVSPSFPVCAPLR